MQHEVEVIVRDRNTVYDYLYYLESGKNNPGNEKVIHIFAFKADILF